MNCLSKNALLACALMMLMPSAPIHADEINNSQASVFISTLVSATIVFSPVIISEKLHDQSMRSDCDCPQPRRNAAGEVPDMEVKAVGQDENGAARVYLQAPDAPEVFATLVWPAQTTHPAAGFRAGQMVSFQPSAQRAGWMLRDAAGQALAFVPTEGAARELHAALF